MEDTGPGLGPSEKSKVFDAFFTTKPGGMGIGLAICRRIIEAHGGTLGARERPGGGAVFGFTLPRQGEEKA